MKFSISIRLRRVFFAVTALLFWVTRSPARAQFETRATNPFPQGAFSIATGDFNREGKLGVVMRVEGGFAVALGNGEGTFQKGVTSSTQLSFSRGVADFNGDGNRDFITADDNYPSTVSVYLGNGDGTFK